MGGGEVRWDGVVVMLINTSVVQAVHPVKDLNHWNRKGRLRNGSPLRETCRDR